MLCNATRDTRSKNRKQIITKLTSAVKNWNQLAVSASNVSEDFNNTLSPPPDTKIKAEEIKLLSGKKDLIQK